MSGWKLMVTESGMLRGQREKLGLSQEEVAKKADITLAQYQRYEKRDVNISSSSMRIVTAVLTALELDPTLFKKGEYSLDAIAEDSPLGDTLRKFGL